MFSTMLSTDEVDDTFEDLAHPLGNLPQTWIVTAPISLIVFGISAIGAGIVLKGKKKKDETE